MKYKHTFLYSFIVGICVVIFVVLYIRFGNLGYGPDIIKDRIIPIGGLLLSMVASAVCTISYQKYIKVISIAPPVILFFKLLFCRRVLVPSFYFPFGILIGEIILSTIFGKPISQKLLFHILPIFIALYVFGIIGAIVSTIFVYTKNSGS